MYTAASEGQMLTLTTKQHLTVLHICANFPPLGKLDTTDAQHIKSVKITSLTQ